MWDLPGPGLEPVSPALVGGFLTTAPPGEHPLCVLVLCLSPPYPQPPPWATVDFFFIVSIVLPFPEYYIVGIIQPEAFSDRLLSLTMH